MTISRKHYEAVAIEFGTAYSQIDFNKDDAHKVFSLMQEAFVTAMRRVDAPRFDVVTFKTFLAEVACGHRDCNGKRVLPNVQPL